MSFCDRQVSGIGEARTGRVTFKLITIGMRMPSDLPSDDAPFFEYGAALLTAMADRDRLVILRSLVNAEMSLNALAMLTGVGKRVCSQELDRLQAAGLVHRRVERETAYFSCRSESVQKVLEAIGHIRPYGNRG